MRTPHARFALFAALTAALAFAGPAVARADAQQGADAATSAPANDSTGVTTGSIGRTPAEKRQRQFEDCMEIWEPATHMTKRQWRRTCRSQLGDEPNL